MRRPVLILLLLFVICFGLAAHLEPRIATVGGGSGRSAGFLETLMGDSRRLFATHFILKADAYFHSGYYPGAFDDATAFEESHIAGEVRADGVDSHDHHDHDHDHHEEEGGFLGKPRDWIDRFSRNFFPTSHTHLDHDHDDHDDHDHEDGHDHDHDRGHDHDHSPSGKSSGVREILPWLKLSAELDPNRVEVYVITAYWLRTQIKKPEAAERFLRDGLRLNPGNPALLFELGRLAEQSRSDTVAARNLWEFALRKWQELEAPKKEPDKLLLSQIAAHLARLEEREGRFDDSIAYWQLVRSVSPTPGEIDKRIAEVREKQAAASPAR